MIWLLAEALRAADDDELIASIIILNTISFAIYTKYGIYLFMVIYGIYLWYLY